MSILVCLAVGSTFVAAQATSEPRPPRKLSTAVGAAFALGKAGERWAKLVGERSAGKLVVTVHPGAALAQRDPGREFLALVDGRIDLAVGSTLLWSQQVNELGVVGLPWIAPEARQLGALVTGAMKERLAAAIVRAGAVPLAFAALGHRQIATVSKSVRTTDDLIGLKVRMVSTPFLVDFYAGMQAQPRSMAFAAAETAFRAGALDAQDGTLATFAAARVDAMGVKQVTIWNAVAEVAVFAASRGAWDAMAEPDRAVVREAAEDAARELPGLVGDEDAAALAELRRRGVTIQRLTASGRRMFAAAARPVYDRWAAVAGDNLVRAAEAAVSAATP
jgi:TRAP-type C4-dicarboxylate transport system substrate-binding protein